jgi:UDP-glucose 4-epimerase
MLGLQANVCNAAALDAVFESQTFDSVIHFAALKVRHIAITTLYPFFYCHSMLYSLAGRRGVRIEAVGLL